MQPAVKECLHAYYIIKVPSLYMAHGSETAIDQTAEELPLPRLCKVKVSQLVYGAITVEVWVMPTAEEANRSSLAWFWTRWWPEPLQTQNASSTRWQTFARVAY